MKVGTVLGGLLMCLQPWSAVRFILLEACFWTCPVAGLSVIGADGLNENRPTLRYLRVEELAAFTRARRARRSAYCACGSLQLEGAHDPTMPHLWRQQPCSCQTPV